MAPVEVKQGRKVVPRRTGRDMFLPEDVDIPGISCIGFHFVDVHGSCVRTGLGMRFPTDSRPMGLHG